MRLWRGISYYCAVLSLGTIVSCTKSEISNRQLFSGVANPVPTDRESIDSQLSRYPGQTKFLNARYEWRGGLEMSEMAEARGAKSADGGGPRREMQESDVFKIGKPGTNLLYLLNNARGLQIVSFKEGAAKPQLIGRVPASGNTPNDMYYDKNNDRLYTLETLYFNSEDEWSRERDSRVVIYDVSNPQQPKQIGEQRMKGQIADSRIVGDVLYVATSEWPSWGEPEENKKGNIFSFEMGKDELKLVEHRVLSRPISGAENMNIVEIENDGDYKYYLVAVLPTSEWGWWDRNSAVEVVDISDAKGKIKPVLLANARGVIRERSQTTIKNNTLIVSSNYQPDFSRGSERPRQRVAVETFRFPSANAKVLSADEAELRRLYIKTEAEKIADLDQRDEKLKELLADKTWGLKGVYVADQATQGQQQPTLKKLASDSIITVGSNDNLDTDAQDTRISNDRLLVFWKPRDLNKDPLDVFDISKPEEGVVYKGRTLFEGFVERAFPISYQGKELILTLGHVSPTVNNERTRSFPAAYLFELREKSNKQVTADLIAEFVMTEKQHTWVDFNAPDKFIELAMTGEGKGRLLFQISSWGDKKFESGGKIINFDINKALDGQEGTFREGGVIVGESSWLKRVFSNPELEALHTFSDLELRTFNAGNDAGTIERALSVLELARNADGYLRLGDKAVQIISNYSYGSDSSSIELRLVDPSKADTELPGAQGSLKLEGMNYNTSRLVSKDGRIYFLSQIYRSEETKEKNEEGQEVNVWKQFVKYSVRRVELKDDKLTLTGNLEWETPVVEQRWGDPRAERMIGRGGRVPPWFGYRSATFSELPSGEILLSTGNALEIVTTGANLEKKTLDQSACKPAEAPEDLYVSVALVGSQLVASYVENVKDEKRKTISYDRNFASLATLAADGKLSCEKWVNVPGIVVAVKGNALLTEDQRLVDFRESARRRFEKDGKEEVIETEYYPVTTPVLDSLKVTDVATLADLYDLKEAGGSVPRALSNGDYVYLTQSEYSDPEFVIVGRGEDLRFNETRYVVESQIRNGSLSAVVESENETIAILSSYRRAQVLSWTKEDARPRLRKVSVLNAAFEKEKPTDVVRLAGYYGGDGDKVSYSPADRSLVISQGMVGWLQAYVE